MLKNILVGGNICIGCRNHGADIMITYVKNEKDDNGYHLYEDVFLNTEQTKKLIEDLQKELEENEFNIKEGLI